MISNEQLIQYIDRMDEINILLGDENLGDDVIENLITEIEKIKLTLEKEQNTTRKRSSHLRLVQ